MMCPKYRRYFTPISILDAVIDNRSYERLRKGTPEERQVTNALNGYAELNGVVIEVSRSLGELAPFCPYF